MNSRRNFLKTTGLGVSAALVSSGGLIREALPSELEAPDTKFVESRDRSTLLKQLEPPETRKATFTVQGLMKGDKVYIANYTTGEEYHRCQVDEDEASVTCKVPYVEETVVARVRQAGILPFEIVTNVMEDTTVTALRIPDWLYLGR